MRPDAKPVLILLSDGKQDEIPSVAGVASEPLLNETIEAVKAKGIFFSNNFSISKEFEILFSEKDHFPFYFLQSRKTIFQDEA